MSVATHNDLVVVDLFAGAGGGTSGAKLALARRGLRAQIAAVNHWDRAIATHAANHPEARHYRANIRASWPRHVVPGGRVDVMIAGIECIHHSRAAGGKPRNPQSRAQAAWLLKWLRQIDVRCLLVENVPEFQSWGDLDEKGRPVSKLKGKLFIEWLGKLQKLGYRYEYRVLNAANYGDATTRERFFLIARKDDGAIVWPEPTHRKPAKPGEGTRFDALPPWRPARDIIDWSDLGESLLDRPTRGQKPLSIKTRLRIARGLQMFGGALAPLYIRLLDLLEDDEARFINGCAGGLARSFAFGNRANNVPVGPDFPIPSITTATGGGLYLVSPTAEPFVLGQQSESVARDTGRPIPTVAAAGVVRLFAAVAEPFLDVYYQTGVADSIRDPLSTTTTKPRHALVSPVVVPFHGGTRRQSERAYSPDDPLRTLTTEPRFGVATPVASVITPGFAERAGQAPRIHSIDDAAPTIAATGHLHLATATIQLPSELGGVDPRRLVLIDGVLWLLDILFRMLTNTELAAAMGFPDDYVFTGTKSDVTKQIGNAVPVNLAAALVAAILDPEMARERAS